ncbi:MAG: NAD(P)-binding domain-containing protein [Thermomicrobiales bacterium]
MHAPADHPDFLLDADAFPIAIVGAGPIGLAAAAHLARKQQPFIVLEAGPSAASAVRAWGHITLFTPWQYSVDAEAVALLEAHDGWTMPDPETFPTGADLLTHYLEPLAAHPAIAPHIRYGRRVTAIAHDDLGKLEGGRDEDTFVLLAETPDGTVERYDALSVIDASGVWSQPNPIGANGLPVPGEDRFRDRIAMRIPDVIGADRARYAGKRTLVVGSGHSAMNVLASLVELGATEPGTEAIWALRRELTEDTFAACDGPLTEQTLILRDIRDLVQGGTIEAWGGVRIRELIPAPDGTGVIARTRDGDLPPVDEIVVATGFRPDHTIARELQLDLHPVFECVYGIAALVDPEANACGTVPPHGAAQLAHPEPDYYLVGNKSFGRAPTFLLYTGYEQVRSVVAALTGDIEGSAVTLELPDLGLCAACTAYLEEQDAVAASEAAATAVPS